MVKIMKEKLVVLLALLLLIPFLLLDTGNIAEAATATPSFAKTSLEIKGIGETYSMTIKNKVARSTYSWSSSKKSVATVTKSGIITAKGAGTAMIKCKITYPNKKTKTLSCKVTVTVPATAVDIKELQMKNNAYQLALNGTVNLDAVLTPANSTDKIFWYVDKDNILSDPTCVTLDNANQGIVTGVKAGKAVVRVRAVKKATQAYAAISNIDDAIIIEVVAPKAEMKSADITGNNQIVVVFDSPVQKSTVINSDNTLSSNITISLCKVNKVLANDPGKLTASLSSDSKTLTITTEKDLKGTYGIKFSSKILTTTGVPLNEDYKEMSFIDTINPYIEKVTLDDSGLVATISFNEAIDFSGFGVKPATVINSATTVSPTTLSLLSNTANYVISQDKKSVTVNMSNIPTSDYGKSFMVTFAGIKDMAGNYPTSYTLSTIITTDTSPKPQAQLINITRTGYNTLTAIFTRGIKTPGYIQINGGAMILGVVDTTDKNKVNYTITGNETIFTGIIQVSIGHWDSYNVILGDQTANQMTTRNVDFTVDKISPVCVKSEYDYETNLLTLTYTEPVTLTSPSGIFTAVLTTSTDDVVNGININYTSVIHALGNNIIQLKLTTNSTKTGVYSFTIPQGFVKDNFNNFSISNAVVINNTNGTSELPGPYMISQSPTNLKEITIMFSNKVDVASATQISNYQIPGVTILSARVDSNATETGATIVLTVQSIDVTASRPITITGVKGYNNSYTAISTYTTSISLKENQSPLFLNPPVFDSTRRNIVNLNFGEAVQGTLTVTVTQVYGSTQTVLTNTVAVSGNSASITLGSTPINGSYLKIDIVTNNVTDAAGNLATFPTTTLGVNVSY